MNTTIAERELGNIPVSIATALAIDGLYNRHPDLKPSRVLPASQAKVIYINARTLFRNIHGAIGDRVKANQVHAREYADTILLELDELKNALAEETHSLEVVLYLPSYKSIASYMGNGELRPLNTDNQKAFNKLENDTLQDLFDRYHNKRDEQEVETQKPFIGVDMVIKIENYQNIFIMTHLPVDLLNIKNASEVFLVESHTGKVKPKEYWYTKFHAERDPHIPFNKATLLFFGDSGGLFKPQHVKARNRVLQVAKERKWNAHTTDSRMLLGLELSKEPHLLSVMRALFR